MFVDPSIFYSSWLDRVQTMVRFSEAKNATLLAGVLAVFLACVQNELANQFVGIWKYVYSFALVTLGFTFLDTAASFWPRARSPLAERSVVKPELNPLYFGDVAHLTVDQLADEISAVTPDQWSIGSLERHYLEQIIQNSRICESKLKNFQRAGTFFAASIIMIFASLMSLHNLP